MEICLTASQMLETMLPEQKPDTTKTYHPSIYNQFHTTQKDNYIYNVLTRRLAKLTDGEKCLLQETAVDGALPAAAPLIAKRFLVEKGTDELSHYIQLHSTQELFLSAADRGINMYRILPTTGCNARCFYCFEQGVQITNMNETTADAVIDYIKRTRDPQKKLHLEWFGGEPLLRTATIDKICNALTSEAIDFYSTMTTNGSLLTEALIQKAKNHWNLEKVQITLDGVGETHDRRKAYVALQDAYNRTLQNLKALVAADIGVVVRMNMDRENAHSIQTLCDDLKTQYCPADRIAFDPALLFAAQKDADLQKTFYALRQQLYREGFLKVKALGEDLPRNHCMANSATAVTILPDGTLTACDAGCETMYYGDIWQGITKPEVYKAWLSTKEIREKCRTCPYLPQCTGFALCPYENANCQAEMADILSHRLATTVRKYEKN